MFDLVRLLEDHPEWRAEMRRLVLSNELLMLPEIVARLADRVDQLGERMDQLTVRVDQLGERMDQLTVRVDRLGERMDQLTVRVDRLGEQLEALLASHQRMVDDIGGLKGSSLEAEYRQRAPSYFGPLVRKGRVVDVDELWDLLEPALTSEELNDALLADVIVRGAVRDEVPIIEVVLVVEVSFVVDRLDVERAQRRCRLLRRAGLPAVAVVAGERATDGARLASEEGNVVVIERHQPRHWDLALRDLAA